MKNGYYINQSCYMGERLTTPGVENKIEQQIQVFSQYFRMRHFVIKQKEREYIKKRLPFYRKTYNIEEQDEIINPEFIYFRKCRLERGLFLYFKTIKKMYPNCKLIIELPTFPYDADFFQGRGGIITQFPFYLKDVYYRNKLKNIVDRFVVYQNYKEIFGVKAISTLNGIVIDKFPLKKRESQKNDLCMLAVANFQKGHGYERVITGMYQYYRNGGKRKVSLLMIGEGVERTYYERLATEYKLTEHIYFLGQKTGKELDEYYDRADITLGCFGQYKLGFDSSSALKIREALARGMPVVSGCKEDVLTGKNIDFYLEFPNNSSVIEIEKIIDFYDKIKDDVTLPEKIRKFAIHTVSMEKTLLPILKYITREGESADER